VFRGIVNLIQRIDYRLILTKNINNELDSEAFSIRAKDGPQGVFTSRRRLTINNLIFILLGFKSSIQRELDRFYKALSDEDFNIRAVTKGALTQARANLNPEAFKRLNTVAANTYYNEVAYYNWHGMRTLSVDGTRLVLPNHPSIIEEFGQHKFGPNADSPRSLALGSMLYDVLNHITIDAQIAPYASSERDLLVKHLEYVQKEDLLLLDRGYPCFLAIIFVNGQRHCVLC
jgi:hypothetical protein